MSRSLAEIEEEVLQLSEQDRATLAEHLLHCLMPGEVLRKALRSELTRLAGRRRLTPWELGKDLFGQARSGRRDLSTIRARDLLAGAARGKRVRG